MKTYTVTKGDTFERISRRVYGHEGFASRVRAANPETAGGLIPGAVLRVPGTDTLPVPDAPASSATEVAILINGERFRFWTEVSLFLSMDVIDSFSLIAPFEPDNEAFRAAFKPMSFADVSIFVGGVRLFTGTMVDVLPVVDESTRSVAASGYARCGVLNDIPAPPTDNRWEFNEVNLKAVADSMVEPFGLESVFTSEAGAKYTRLAITPSEKILAFLIRQAKQHSLIVTNDAEGRPLFQKSAGGSPVADLEGSPVVAVAPNFNPQEYYSSITVAGGGFIGIPGATATKQNSRLQGVLRPMTIIAPDLLSSDLPQAADAAMGRMFATAVSYDVGLAGWQDPTGALWAPNTRARLLAPGAMIYDSTEFTIRSVELSGTPKSQRAVLGLVLPESFAGGLPERMPWDT